MISNREINVGRREVRIKGGDVFVTKMDGKSPEVAMVSRVIGNKVQMVNFEEGRPFATTMDRIDKGMVGKSAIVEGISTVKTTTPGYLDRLGTDMIVVNPKGSDEEVLTIVTGYENGDVLLSPPERPDIQMVKVPEEDLMKGKSDSLNFQFVPPKFSLLKDSERLAKEQEAKRKESIMADKPVINPGNGIPSRDIDFGVAVGEVLPDRTTEERIKEPDAVFQQGLAEAVKAMIRNGEAKALAAAIALYGGNLVHTRLSVVHS